MKKNILLTTIAITTIFGGSVTSFAEGTASKEADVKYDNTNTIVDPENPNDPEYLVRIPGAINFTNENRTVTTTVSMVNTLGEQYTGESEAIIEVSSKNEFKLTAGSGDLIDSIKYSIFNGESTTPETSNFSITLNKDNNKQEGKAVLGQDKAELADLYSDILTFTVTTNNNGIDQ